VGVLGGGGHDGGAGDKVEGGVERRAHGLALVGGLDDELGLDGLRAGDIDDEGEFVGGHGRVAFATAREGDE
jgi:hypothetical protein